MLNRSEIIRGMIQTNALKFALSELIFMMLMVGDVPVT
jgi:hypothetical protein